MPDLLVPYGPALAAWLCLGAAWLAQALVADVAAMRAHHTPGMPVTSGHDDFLFRATRAQANTNENLSGFVVLSLAAMLLGANSWWINRLVWLFVVGRLGHMLAYYADVRPLRSASFGISFACLIGLLVVGIAAAG
jgi:uncharacterized MAPEG superfamily protein